MAEISDSRVEGAREAARSRQVREDYATLERLFAEDEEKRLGSLSRRERLLRRLFALLGRDWWPASASR